MLNRIYKLLISLALLWAAFVGWSSYDEWNLYPTDRWVTILIGVFPFILLAVLNYLLYGRMSPLLKHRSE